MQRSLKFAKYLPHFGWQPTVWAAKRMAGLPVDPSLLADLPGDVTVYRCPGGSGPHVMRRSHHPHSGGRGVASRLARAIEWRLAGWIARAPVPDDCISWAKASVDPVFRLIRKEGIDALYSTFSPASNHLLAMSLKQTTHLPWLADFRDLWTDDYRYNERSPTRRAAHHALQQAILETADAVVGVTARQTEILASHLPGGRQKFVTITNGFDPADFAFAEKERARSDERFVLAHVGRFDHWRGGDAWFAGLQCFIAGLGLDRERFVLRIVGHADRAMRCRLGATGAACAFTEYVSHGEAIREMRSADALLLSVPWGPNADSVIPAKLFEYLAAGRPILVVGPPGGECEKIVTACRAGPAVGFDQQAIAAALARLYTAWAAGRPLPGCSDADVAPHSRIEQTHRLAGILDGLIEQGPCGSDLPAGHWTEEEVPLARLGVCPP